MPMYMSAKQRKEQQRLAEEEQKREAEEAAERKRQEVRKAKLDRIAESKYYFEIKQQPDRELDENGRGQFWYFILEKGVPVKRFGEFDSYPGHPWMGHRHKDLLTGTYEEAEDRAIEKTIRAIDADRREEELDGRPDIHSWGHSQRRSPWD